MKKITIIIYGFYISFFGFNVSSQIPMKDIEYSITANRTLWRINTFLKSNNIDYRIQKRDYEEILFKKDETEKFDLKSIDSLETDVYKFYEFSFKYRCSYENDEETNIRIKEERKFWEKSTSTIKWKDSTIQLTDSLLQESFPECECCYVHGYNTIRNGNLYQVPQCFDSVGLIAINKKVWRNIYFISGGCIYLSKIYPEMFFQDNDANDIQNVKKYIYSRFWEGFSTNKYILKNTHKINDRIIQFEIEDKDKNQVFKYSLNLKSGEIR